MIVRGRQLVEHNIVIMNGRESWHDVTALASHWPTSQYDVMAGLDSTRSFTELILVRLTDSNKHNCSVQGTVNINRVHIQNTKCPVILPIVRCKVSTISQAKPVLHACWLLVPAQIHTTPCLQL